MHRPKNKDLRFLISNRLITIFGKDTNAIVAAKINVTESQVSQYKRNLSTPGIETLFDIAVTYNASLDYIFNLKDEIKT
ncbi:MAG: helix-turn-helix transcriptional regulator [Thioploca sp.]|nr:helix-turn-helix transcriptional regulator [Thioploca sp.]